MGEDQLWRTTMTHDTRRLLPCSFCELGLKASEDRFTMLMGKGEAAARRSWLEEHGNEVDADI